MPDFAELLKQLRQASGLSQRALARAAAINPAIANRLESGDRGPSGPDQVRAIARALGLDPNRSDQLLGAAGFWPDVFLRVGPGDPTLLRVARLLARPDLSDPDRARFRQIVDLLIDQWLEGGYANRAP
ncbi:MAG: helix-turn-helix domain-containing protein [Chloroflexota bacterium]